MSALFCFAVLSISQLADNVGADPIWPAHLNINDQIANVHHAGCSGLCSWNGFLDGYVIGTAPVCGATCENDCSGRACFSYIPGNVAGFMPDAGDMCDNELLEAAYVVFKDRKDPVNTTFHDLMMNVKDKGKACCCQSPLPRKDSFKKKEQPTEPGTTSCDDWCQGGGFGHGVTIGTAPFCGASCAEDCSGNVCSSSNNFFSDHGDGCASGDKVCCCAKKAVAGMADKWKYSTEILDPPSTLPSSFSCSDLCSSGGWGGGHVSGTAPSCGGHCDDCNGGHCFHVSHGDLTDYGHGCASGNKVCCCDNSDPDQQLVI